MIYKFHNNRQGSVAVYLCIIFLSLIIVASVITDAVCVHTAQIHAERAVDIATRSVLAEYDQNLKNEYGIFGTFQTKGDMEEKITAYTNRMLNPTLDTLENEEFLDIYDFQIESVNVETDNLSLNNLELLENQIMDYMRYRAVLGELVDFTKEIDAIQKASNALELVNKAAVVYEEMNHLKEELNLLRKYCDGWYYDDQQCFNTYPNSIKSLCISKGVDGESQYEKNNCTLLKQHEKNNLSELLMNTAQLKEMNETYMKDLEEYVYLRCSIEALAGAKKALFMEKMSSGDTNEQDQYSEILSDIREKKEAYESKLDNEQLEEHVLFYERRRQSCLKALECIDSLKLTGQHIQELIHEVEGYIEQNDDNIFFDLKESVIKDMEKATNLVGEKYVTSLVNSENTIEQNESTLQEWMDALDFETSINRLEKQSYRYGLEANPSMDIDAFLKQIQRNINQDNTYNLSREKCNEAWVNFSYEYESDFLIEPFSSYETNPLSQTHTYEIDSIEDLDDTEVTNEQINNNRQLKNDYITQLLPSNICEIVSEPGIDFNIEELNIKNKLYLGEYVLSLFSYHTHEGEMKDSFFKHEVEYILYGENNESVNFYRFQQDLFLLRSGMNLIHIYSDPTKRQQTLNAALVLSGGVGTFLVQFLVASAWSAAETKVDLDQLTEGEAVPLIKTKDNWILSFDHYLSGKKNSITKNKKNNKENSTTNNKKDNKINKKIDELNMLDYDDYLRIFLLFKKRENTLYRILDLIQLNMKGRHYKDFETRYYWGACKVNMNVSVKYLFLKFKWMPEKIRNATMGRKKFQIKVEHSY